MNGGRFKLAFSLRTSILLFVAALVADKAQGEEGVLIAAFGDSLSSGYGLAADEGFSPVLQRVLSQRGLTVSVINAAVAGDTSADALARVDWMLSFKPDIVLVNLVPTTCCAAYRQQRCVIIWMKSFCVLKQRRSRFVVGHVGAA